MIVFAFNSLFNDPQQVRNLGHRAFEFHVLQPLIAEGEWHGRILRSPRGDRGFGYDPVFFDPENACSAAELDPVVKNAISHRGRALAALKRRLPTLS